AGCVRRNRRRDPRSALPGRLVRSTERLATHTASGLLARWARATSACRSRLAARSPSRASTGRGLLLRAPPREPLRKVALVVDALDLQHARFPAEVAHVV